MLLESYKNSKENKDRCEMLSDCTGKKNQWPIRIRSEISWKNMALICSPEVLHEPDLRFFLNDDRNDLGGI